MVQSFKIFFYCLEFILFLILFCRLLINKIHKKFTSAGLCYFFSSIVFSLFCASCLMPYIFLDNCNVLLYAKTFLYISGTIYLQIYLYKIQKNFLSNSAKQIKKFNNNIEELKKNMYSFSEFLFLIESLCVGLFSCNKSFINFFEIVPIISLTIFLIYQLIIYNKTKRKTFWLYYTIATIIFLTLRVFIENVNGNVILQLLSVVIRIIQLLILSYITISSNNELENCYI